MIHARYRFGAFALDTAKRELLRDAEVVPLPARVFECLLHLIEHRDRAVGRDELAHAVFGRHNVSDAQIGQIILRARRVIDDDGHVQHHIRTIPRFGFRWVAETQAEAPAAMDEAPPAAVDAATPAAIAAAAAEPVAVPLASEPAPRPPVAAAPRARGWAWLALAAVLAGTGGLALWWTRDAGTPPRTGGTAPATVLVLPAEVDGPAEASWARLGMMDFVADRLRRAGLPVPSSESTLVLLRQTGGGARDSVAVRRIARAERVVRSEAVHRGGRWYVALSAMDSAGVQQRGEAEGSDLLGAAGQASDRLLSALGHAPPANGDTDLDLAERVQRARAAMFANELETARQILLEAPELQRAQPQLRYRLVQIDFRAGRFEQGIATVDELLRGDAAREPVFRARLLNARGAMCIRLDRYAEAERGYTEAAGLLDPARDHAELGQALTGRAITRSAQGRFEPALADLGQARVHMLRAGDRLSVARIDANLGQFEMDRDRPAQALQYLPKAAADFESFGAINELVVARSSLVRVNLRLLRHDEARTQIEKAWALRERVRDPMQLGMLTLDRAEVLIRQGRFDEARPLLSSPATERVPPSERQRRTFLQAELAWRAGDARAAARLAEEALREWAPDAMPRLQGWLRLRRLQAAQAAELPPGNPVPLTPAPASASVAPLPAPSLPDRLAQALVERAAGRDEAADEHFRQALSQAEQGGVPEDILEAAAIYAPWLIERGRFAEAGALVGRVAPWAERDFDAALLQLRLYHAMGQQALSAAALEKVRRLAGERPIPAVLLEQAAVSGASREP